MKVLVTGGAGYVGAVLVPQLLELGYQVEVLDVLRYGGDALLPLFRNPAFSFTKGDVNDSAIVQECVRRADAVIHLAAIVGFPACQKYPELARSTNVGGLRNVVSALSSSQLLIYASTGSNYGKQDRICTEESPLTPTSLYGVTKTEAERIALSAPWSTALRFATGFGVSPRMRLDLLINDFVRLAMVDRQLILYERHVRRSFIHVQDMARAFLFALEHSEQMRGQPYNVGHESLNLTKAQIAQKIRDRIDYYLHFAEIGTDADNRDYEVSYNKIRALGFETSVTIDEGIEELIRAMAAIEIPRPYSNV